MQLIITPKAQKHFGKLPKPEQKKIIKKLSVLADDPLSGKKLEGDLQEIRSIRAWPYRILYYIDTKNKTVYITSILHRQGAYK